MRDSTSEEDYESNGARRAAARTESLLTEVETQHCCAPRSLNRMVQTSFGEVE